MLPFLSVAIVKRFVCVRCTAGVLALGRTKILLKTSDVVRKTWSRRMSADVRNSSQEVGEEYASSLADLTVNSKPLINMLTMLAEENIEFAPVIVKVIEKHLAQVYIHT